MFKCIYRTISRLRGASSKTFASFKPFLAEVCREFDPKRVLEFGVGTSTAIILENSKAQIISIEESKEWYEEYRSKFSSGRVELYYKEPGWDLCELNGFGRAYDLIFIDGGNRLAELKHCFDLLGPDGIAFLHDAHREEYESGIRAYPQIIFPERHSCLMCKSPDVMARLKIIITPDMSCRCRYCNTESRNRYLARFM